MCFLDGPAVSLREERANEAVGVLMRMLADDFDNHIQSSWAEAAAASATEFAGAMNVPLFDRVVRNGSSLPIPPVLPPPFLPPPAGRGAARWRACRTGCLRSAR